MTDYFRSRLSPGRERQIIDHPLIKNLQQLDKLTDEEKRTLLNAVGQEKHVRKGDDVVQEGDRPWASLVLVEGFAGRYKVDVDGNRQINAIHVPGDFVDLHSFVLKQMDHSVLAISDCTFAMVPHDALREITISHPHLTRLLWTSTAVDGAILRGWLTQIGGQNAARRTAHLICELFVRLRGVGLVQGHTFSIPLVQTDLADMLGLSHVHMNRTLMSLRRDELVSWHGGTATIHDWDRLKAVARFDAAYLNLRSEAR